MKVNGWHFDPTEGAAGAWVARVGPHTWRIVSGDLDDPPTWAPDHLPATAPPPRRRPFDYWRDGATAR